MSKPNPPESLADAGKALWLAVTAKYELRADELAVLGGACRAADMVAALQSVWEDEGRPMYTKGSMGQLIEHPAPKGMRSWQAAQDSAFARLKLPDDTSGAGEKNQQRDAANSRWAQAHGSGA